MGINSPGVSNECPGVDISNSVSASSASMFPAFVPVPLRGWQMFLKYLSVFGVDRTYIVVIMSLEKNLETILVKRCFCKIVK
jgi:hypothetical protein